ncbi:MULTISPECIES: hypothetical protein [unclassified Pseudomonas]|nr:MULTISPECIES: hypothetical protein [unclassified Pseudomonas]MEB0042657.1 hypothetical protein [Pseudomonas sp. MH10]MEB0121689.1 hypothetical protein [Pseudomonas sp. CCI1.2]WPX66600.1 hypothetical protein RHM59_21980 [Pseudomonas sp. MH10]
MHVFGHGHGGHMSTCGSGRNKQK